MRSGLDSVARHFPGGPAGNRRLTALLGLTLLVGTAVEMGTLLLGLQRTMPVHIVVGVALIPVVLAKLASTGWRMVRYYTRNTAYRRDGPPKALLRGIAPLVVGATLSLLGSGVALVVQGRGSLLGRLHGPSFAVFLVVVGIHAFAHLPKVRDFAFADWARGGRLQGHSIRRAIVGFAVVTGLALGVIALHSAVPAFSALGGG